MKTICTLSLFLIVISSFSQSDSINFNSLTFTDVVFEKQKQKNTQFLVDSFHLYIGDTNNQWVLQTRSISTARNSDGNLTSYDSYRLDDNQNMILAEKGFISYHDSTVQEKYFIKGIDYPFAGYNDTIYYNEYNSLGLPIIRMDVSCSGSSINTCIMNKKLISYNGSLITEVIGIYSDYDSVSPLTYFDISKKNTYSYNQNGKIKTDSSFNYDSYLNIWGLESVTEHSYNSNNDITCTKVYTFDNSSNTLKLTSYDTLVYDGNNNLILYLNKRIGQNNSLENKYKEVYVYNSSGVQTTRIVYKWYNYTWKGYMKYHSFYVNGLKTANITYLGSYINPNYSGWQEYFRQLYSFNQYDSVSSVISQEWNFNNVYWENSSRTEFTYNSLGENINSNTFDYDATSSSWILIRNSQRIFDTHNNLTDYILKSTYNGLLMKHEKYSYFYSQLPASLDDIQSTKISIYPNPTSDFIFIKHIGNAKIKDVEIYTIEGKMVKKSFANTIINVKDLENSIYFIKVEYYNGESFIEKFVKK